MNKKNDSFTCDTQGRQEKDLLEDSFGYKGKTEPKTTPPEQCLGA